ncbi:MAG TPA: hypothetical protein GXZ47_04680 [Treponema sp.]|nr:hypothetical protein [Treponema sp.]
MSTCPNSDLFSAFVDGEVPSPWSEKLEKHIASCSKCAERTERYKRLHLLLSNSQTEPTLDLEQSFALLMERRSAKGTQKKRPTLEWLHQSVQIPLPAIAALFLLAIILPAWFSFRAGVHSNPTQHIFSPGLASLSENNDAHLLMSSMDTGLFSTDFPLQGKSTSFLNQEKKLFTVVNYARQFSPDSKLFEDAEIVIIRLPNLARFAGDDQFLVTDDSLVPIMFFDK